MRLTNAIKPSRCWYSPPPEEGWLRRLRKRPRSEAGADGVVKIISDHPVRAFLTFDGASTPPLKGGDCAARLYILHRFIVYLPEERSAARRRRWCWCSRGSRKAARARSWRPTRKSSVETVQVGDKCV